MASQIPFFILALVFAYLIGSFPAAYLTARIFRKIDIRDVGSRNVGAMNVFYKVGFWPGVMVLAIDIGKGAAAIAFIRWLGAPILVQLLAGFIVVIGHAFPLFLGFRGGRGGATVIGILAYLMPWGIPFYAAIFVLGMLLTRYPTLSYSAAFLCYPFVAWLRYDSPELIIFSLAILLLPLIKYIPRIIEMRKKGGSWKHVVMRKDVKDRF
ncbi:MAG: glycerol-3-phosphate acyltransferase [Chloroflexi bacterium]|nr:glycerol-3-phosphate acyltransferase [Chloroflexota bacterium]